MMDSFVEAQNNLKRMSYAGCVTLFKIRAKPRSSLLVHTCGHQVTGLKTYRRPKRKDQLEVAHDLPGNIFRSIFRPPLGGVEYDDARWVASVSLPPEYR
jgi:hypothetical protein